MPEPLIEVARHLFVEVTFHKQEDCSKAHPVRACINVLRECPQGVQDLVPACFIGNVRNIET